MTSAEKLAVLDRLLADAAPLLVAYSGGVDSAFLLHRAVSVLGSRCRGVIADSPSLARSELQDALDLAGRFGWPVDLVPTSEFENPDYLANPPDRCFFCKSALFETMEGLAVSRGFARLAYGENADDMQQVRPGRRAAENFRVLAPLRDAGLTKAEIREACRAAGLPVADKPASPCLSSRIPHGTPVTREALARVERGEAVLRAAGFRVFRVRHHGDLARVELAADEFEAFDRRAEELVTQLRDAGYRSVERSPVPYGAPRA